MQFCWEVIHRGAEGPGMRSRHCLAHDRDAKATVLFGGTIWEAGGTLCDDTWEFAAGQWRWIDAVEAPRARHRGAMVYDAWRGWTVLFGGQANNGAMFGDTWIYSGGRWRLWRARFWSRTPLPRCGHSLAFNEQEGVTVLFGGIAQGDQTLGDTWVFNGKGWRLASGTAPPARRYAAFAYDPGLKGCLLYGGSVDDHGREQFADAWLFRDGAWSQLPAGFSVDCRDDHGLAYHDAAHRLVMLDGLQGARGVLVRETQGWQRAGLNPLHPRHQCSPLVWDAEVDGLLMHGGEARHGGPQMDATLALRLA